MTAKRKYNLYWFFRSVLFSGLFFGCLLALLIGSAHCYAVMQSDITGEEVKVADWNGNTFSVLGYEIYSKKPT